MVQNKSLSDWLVVSDVDGTLNNKLRKMPPRNFEAIKSFTAEYGGHFTLASARNVQSLSKHYNNLPERSTPAVVLNGAGIYDYNKEEMIYFNPLSARGMELVSIILNKFKGSEALIFTRDNIFAVRANLYSPFYLAADKLKNTRCKTPDEVTDNEWGKVILFGSPWLIKKINKYIFSLEDTQTNFIKTSVATIDMVNSNVHKGIAVLKLADILGLPHSNTAAIGDYYNDLDMLKSVALSAACGQAPKEVLESAKYHACHCNKGAVGDFLGYIVRTYAK